MALASISSFSFNCKFICMASNCTYISIDFIRVAVPICRQAFVEKFLDLSQYEPKTSAEVHLFVEKFLRPDGVFLLKMVGKDF
uniref:Uncharacterized protein n=1 Tax=Meloidogyne incognita TaxID=6306 RepID=A0A914M4R3_MELIC